MLDSGISPVDISTQASMEDVTAGVTTSQGHAVGFGSIKSLTDAGTAAYVQLYVGQEDAKAVLDMMLGSDQVSHFPPGTGMKSAKRSLIVFMSLVNTLSGAHRDATHSILICTHGAKVVWMTPPETTLESQRLTLGPRHASYPDWLTQDPFQVCATADGLHTLKRQGWKQVCLIPGDSLFIPKGWWHSVYSTKDTIGLSVDIFFPKN